MEHNGLSPLSKASEVVNVDFFFTESYRFFLSFSIILDLKKK